MHHLIRWWRQGIAQTAAATSSYRRTTPAPSPGRRISSQEALAHRAGVDRTYIAQAWARQDTAPGRSDSSGPLLEWERVEQSENGSNSRARPARAADWKDRVDRALTRSSKIPVAMHAEPAYVPVMSPPATLMTAEDLLQTRFPDKRTELVRGVLVVREPAGSRHGLVTMNLGAELAVYAKQTGAGAVYAAETGFKLATNPDTVRAPDIAFVTRDRLPPPDATGYPALAPDLAVEVLSPGDRPGHVLAKVADWLSAGTRLVWTGAPERRAARGHRHDGSETFVTADGALDGEDVLPGFSCSLVSIL